MGLAWADLKMTAVGKCSDKIATWAKSWAQGAQGAQACNSGVEEAEAGGCQLKVCLSYMRPCLKYKTGLSCLWDKQGLGAYT